MRDAKEGVDATPVMRLVGLELRSTMRIALKALDHRSREAVVRKHLLGQTYKQIARAVFGPCSGENEIRHVSVILTRARRKLGGILLPL
jgi:DNA-directed RNA polymerase specialized sigma24 family protein